MTALKMTFGVLVGGFVGYLVANELAPYFWWAGCTVGALLGFIFCGPREFLLAVPRAWYAAGGRLGRRVTRPAVQYASSVSVQFGSILCWIAIGAIGVYEINMLFFRPLGQEHISLFWAVAIPSLILLFVAALVWITFFFFVLLDRCDEDFTPNDGEAEKAERLMWQVFPPTAVYLGTSFVIRNRQAIIRGIGRGAVETVLFLGRFGAALWRFTHSDARIVAALGAAIFAAAGYHADSAIVGAVAGLGTTLAYWFAYSKRFRPQT